MQFELDFTDDTIPTQLYPPLTNLLRHSGIKYFEAGKEYKFNSDTFVFKQHVFNFKPGEWHVAPNKFIDRGGVSGIWGVSHVIELGEYSEMKLSPLSNELLIKRQTPGYMEDAQAAIVREAHYLAELKMKVYPVLFDEGYGYTLMENCGPNLNMWLQQTDLSFDQRLIMAKAICVSLLTATQMHFIHADLKPANLCFSYVGRDLLVRIIDFGSTKISDDKGQATSESLEGTADFTAPELAEYIVPDETQPSNKIYTYSHASDVYATSGILGLVFGIPLDILLQFKDRCKYSEHYQAPYDFSNLFADMQIPTDVDPALLKQIQDLLERMQSPRPEHRPKIEEITTFFCSIDKRRVHYKQFQTCKNQLDEAIQLLEEKSASRPENVEVLEALILLLRKSREQIESTLSDDKIIDVDSIELIEIDTASTSEDEFFISAAAFIEKQIAEVEFLIGMLPSKKEALYQEIQHSLAIFEQKCQQVGATNDNKEKNVWIELLLEARVEILKKIGQISLQDERKIADLNPEILQEVLVDLRNHIDLCDRIMKNLTNVQKTLLQVFQQYTGVREMVATLESDKLPPLMQLLAMQDIARKRMKLNHSSMFSRTPGPRALYKSLDQLPESAMMQLPGAVSELCGVLQDALVDAAKPKRCSLLG